MSEDNPLSGILFGKYKVVGAFPTTQQEVIEKASQFEERLHPRDPGGKFAPKGGGSVGGAAPKPPGKEWLDRSDYHAREMQNIHRRLKQKSTPELRVQFRMHQAGYMAAMKGKEPTEQAIRSLLQGEDERRVYDEKFAPGRKPAEQPKAEEKPKPEEPKAISIDRVKSEAKGVARELSRIGAPLYYGGGRTGPVSIDEVSEDKGKIHLYLYAEGLKIGGPDDIDSNDGTAQDKLLSEGRKMLQNRLPGAEIHPIGSEKGYFGFIIEAPKAEAEKPKVPIGSVRVETGKYKFSSGRSPKGRGQWAFRIGDKTEMIHGDYAEAKGKAVRMAAERGEREVEVLP